MSSSLIIGISMILGIVAFAFFASMYQHWRSAQRNKKRLQNFERLSKVREQQALKKEDREEELEERNLSDNRHAVFMSNAHNPVI